MNAENYMQQAAEMWNQQVGRWMGATTEVQAQTQNALDQWGGQAAEALKEGQKFVDTWTDTVANAQKEFWGIWESALKTSEGVFSAQPARKKRA